MNKVEVKSGPELISQIKSDAENSVFAEGMEVIELANRYARLVNKKNPKPAQSTTDRARDELTAAQMRLAGTLNIIDFFDSLHEQSHYGSTEQTQ